MSTAETTGRMTELAGPPTSRPAVVPGRDARPDETPAQRVERLRRMFAEIDAIPDDDPPGTAEAVMRGIDEGRPERPLFRGMY